MVVLTKKFDREKYTAKYLVDEEHHNMRLDQYLQIYLESFSRQAVKKKIKNGEISIQGRPGVHRPCTRLHYKEIVTLVTHKTIHEDEWWNGQLIDLQAEPEIVFQDDDLIVISKPPFMSTHPSGKHLFNCATVYFESIYHKTIHSIHRLDRETSGILMLGLNPNFTKIMTECFENDEVRKCYFFIAKIDEETFHGDHFTATERLGASESGLKRVYIDNYSEDSHEGKHATTRFKVLYTENGYAIGLAFPVTGRQHQIRVHAMVHGLPLVGDKLYLGSFKMFQRFKDVIATGDDHQLMELPRHALHAIALKIPFQGNEKIFISHIPVDLKIWISEKLSIDLDGLEIILKNEIENYYTKETTLLP
ncbi:MAG: RluA family pseudouridine synthase [Bacteriovoracaceae bacterium]|nr:RluA family pseudouridine synthase [Bacteriovoracaceae bacterium]